jgi:flagellar hook-associated protein 1 FlgK
MLLVDGTIANTLSVSLNTAADEMEVFLSGIEVFPQEGEVAGLLTMRNSTTEGVKKYLSDLNALAREVIEEVNRFHSDGAGLTGHATHTSTNAVSGPLVPLTAAGLSFTPVTGSFDVIVHDATGAVLSTVTVAVTAGVTTLEDVRAAIDADPTLTATISGGLLTVTAGGGSSFTFANDDSDALLALGLNGFFEGTDASNIQISALIDGDLAKIAAGRADLAGLVHPGDSSNALALAQLKDALTLAGGTLSFGGFYASMVETVGQATQESARFVENQERVVELLRNFREEISGVSLDEEMTELIKFQHAYEAAARFIRVADEMLDTLINQM